MAPKKGYRAHLTPGRFWAKVDKSHGPDACWPWTAGVSAWGYGRFQYEGRLLKSAHRVAYELAVGPIPVGLLVRHTCDNPPCCNPAHLELGTNADNASDRDTRGRLGERRGEANGNARLNEQQVREIRAAAASRGLAAVYGVSPVTIQAIRARRIWKHVA